MWRWLGPFAALVLGYTAFAWSQYPAGIPGGGVTISVYNNATEMTDIGTTPTTVTAFDTSLIGSSNDMFTVDAGSDIVTVRLRGLYLIGFQVTATGSSDTRISCGPFVNGNEPAFSIAGASRLVGADEVVSISSLGTIILDDGDTVRLKCNGDSAGDDVTPIHAQFTIARVE